MINFNETERTKSILAQGISPRHPRALSQLMAIRCIVLVNVNRNEQILSNCVGRRYLFLRKDIVLINTFPKERYTNPSRNAQLRGISQRTAK